MTRILFATVLLLVLAPSFAQEDEACAIPGDQACSSAGEGLSLLQTKANVIKPAETRLSAHGKGRGISERIASIKASSSTSDCPCTWNPSYPCSVGGGSCYSFSTKATCEAHAGVLCGVTPTTPKCPCTWDASYACSVDGSCWSDTKSSCEGRGGNFCVSSGPTAPSPPPAPPAPLPASPGGWIQAVLDKTNKYRAEHDAPALTWDASLANQGQSWADSCDFKHSTMGNGENLFAGTGSFSGSSAVASWYNEIKDYSFSNPGFSGSTGHFTQLVWKSTTKVGCGLKLCSYLQDAGFNNAYFLVCEYSPPGNLLGSFAANVLQ